MSRKLLGVWCHLEKDVQGGPATSGGSRTMKYTVGKYCTTEKLAESQHLEDFELRVKVKSSEVTFWTKYAR